MDSELFHMSGMEVSPRRTIHWPAMNIRLPNGPSVVISLDHSVLYRPRAAGTHVFCPSQIDRVVTPRCTLCLLLSFPPSKMPAIPPILSRASAPYLRHDGDYGVDHGRLQHDDPNTVVAGRRGPPRSEWSSPPHGACVLELG